MIDSEAFVRELPRAGVGFCAGVPDSLLKDFCAALADLAPAGTHVVAANEGAAIALAAGHHLASGGLGLVYLQNSGLGNAVNPLMSLADPEVYAIPMLLLVGWRGEPGVADEPQHLKQGRVTEATLAAMEIPHRVLSAASDDPAAILAEAVAAARARRGPVALLARKGSFRPYRSPRPVGEPRAMNREQALAVILAAADADDLIVATTGMASREVFELRAAAGSGHGRDFLTVGCMGHASQIALGIALARPGRRVWCLDGDGAALMHLGALAICGTSGSANFRHLVLNNGAHDSVGGQPTVGLAIDFVAIARACAYRRAESVDSPAALAAALRAMAAEPGPAFLEVRVACGARADLGRPTRSPVENKEEFMLHAGR